MDCEAVFEAKSRSQIYFIAYVGVQCIFLALSRHPIEVIDSYCRAGFPIGVYAYWESSCAVAIYGGSREEKCCESCQALKHWGGLGEKKKEGEWNACNFTKELGNTREQKWLRCAW